MKRLNWVLVAAALLSCCSPAEDAAAEAQAAAPEGPPALVVLCSIDQLPVRLLQATLPHMGEDGFARLIREGVNFDSCAFAHASTSTGPGHATLSTGATPAGHGIIGNDWWDPLAAGGVYCAAHEGAKALVPGGGAGRGPGQLLAPSLGDAMKEQLGPAAKVVSVSWKDRSAILMGGRSADLAVWTHPGTLQMVTNSFYAEEMPEWLVAFNDQELPDSWFGWQWERLGEDSAYAGLVDDRPYESARWGGRTLPKTINGSESTPGREFYLQFPYSPLGNKLILETALAAMNALELGRDDTPDLLCVGFSSNDFVGHYFGPGAVETRDVLLRTDQHIARLLEKLDETVGQGRYVFLLSSDHGVSTIPEAAHADGLDAERARISFGLRTAVSAALVEEFGQPEGVRAFPTVRAGNLYLNRAWLASVGVERADAARVAAAAATEVNGVALALTTEEVLGSPDTDDPIRRILLSTIHPDRSGDVMIVIERNWLDGSTPASHGTPYDYDRRVPYLAMGPGLRPGHVSQTPVTPGIGVVLAAHLLGIPPPAKAVDQLPASVLR